MESAQHDVDGVAEAPHQDFPEGHDQIGLENIIDQEDMLDQSLETDDDFSSAISAPEISELALNATGEARYLGPSSGIPFTGHATAIIRRLISNRASEHVRATSESFSQSQTPLALTDRDRVYEVDEVEALVRSYVRWIQPLYPLYEATMLKTMVKTCQDLEARGGHGHHSPQHTLKMAEYYLVLALGAIHNENTNDEAVRPEHSPDTPRRISPKRDPVRLYRKSLEYFDMGSSDLPSSISSIRVILLMCIYGSHGKAGIGQWQLAGLAVRVSLLVVDDECMLTDSDGRRDRLASNNSCFARDRRRSGCPEPCLLDRLHHRNFARLQPWAPAVNRGRAHHRETTSPSFHHASMRPSYKT